MYLQFLHNVRTGIRNKNLGNYIQYVSGTAQYNMTTSWAAEWVH